MTLDDALDTQLLALFGQASSDDAARAAALLDSDDGRAWSAERDAAAAARHAAAAADYAARRAAWAAQADRAMGRTKPTMKTCPKCLGRGLFEQYRHRSGGVCYRCYGSGAV